MGAEMKVKEYPKLSKGFFKNDVFRDEDGSRKWVVGDLEEGSQFILRDRQMQEFQNILQHLDGKNSIDQIAQKSHKRREEVVAMLEYMERKGLIEGVEGIQETNFNEVDQFSICLYKYNFPKIEDQDKRKFARGALKAVDLLLIISALFFIRNVFFADTTGGDLSSLLSYGAGERGKWLGYLLINLGMVISFALHELGHLFAGIKNGIEPERFQFSLFLGFMPMFYIKNKNIYSLPRRKIVDVLLAGIKINFFLFLLLMNLYAVSGIELFKILSLSNLRIIFVNLFPLTLSDGYFILTVLTGFSNLRQNYHIFLARPKQWKTFNSVEKIYTIFALITLILTLMFEIQWLLSLMPIPDGRFRIELMILIILIYLYFIHSKDSKRFFKKEVNYE